MADQPIEHATKDEACGSGTYFGAQCGALCDRYGDLPLEKRLDFLHATELSEEQARLVAEGLATFVGVLGNTLQFEQPKH